MAYDKDKDRILVKIDHPDTDLAVYVASYDDGPVRIRLQRDAKNGKSYPCHNPLATEVPLVIDLFTNANSWLDENGLGVAEEVSDG